jgi:hypothetical protein
MDNLREENISSIVAAEIVVALDDHPPRDIPTFFEHAHATKFDTFSAGIPNAENYDPRAEEVFELFLDYTRNYKY